jgi:cell division protein FtsB
MQQRERIINAVEALNWRGTVGDVSTRSGLELAVAQQELNSLAQDAGGHLQVSSTGEIVYAFEANTRERLVARDRNAALKAFLKSAGRAAFYLLRISFGILLIASLVLIAVAIFVLMNASRNDNDGGDSRSEGGPIFIPGFYWYDVWLFMGPSDPYTRLRDPERMGFLESVFSFLFGDGDPNAELEERRWRAVAGLIRDNGGVVVAEQLAPYLDDASTEHEDYVLPALVRYNGQPEVSEAGEIVYRFPDLQVQATAAAGRARPPEWLDEALWRFSRATGGQITLAAGLGILNFLGAWWLWFTLQGVYLPARLGWIEVLTPLLVLYGTLFLAIPAVRYFVLQQFNQGIRARNDRRAEFARRLREMNAALRKKLAFARQFARKQVIGDDDIIYTTEKNTFEQRDSELDARRFKELEEN